jgi:NADH-quinone oxidoreductase subunit L
MMLPIVSALISAAAAHPLVGTVAGLIGWLPLLPLAGALINGVIAIRAHSATSALETSASTARHPVVAIAGTGSVIAAFGLAVAVFIAMLGAGTLDAPFIVTFGHWIPAGNLTIDWAFQLDQLSMLMVLVITGVGALIHLFSVGYMRDDAGYARYFAYLNLFVAFMLVLVLGASYPLMFVGWEGVGLCSYLLIGFWFSERANVAAGTKAFVVNRIGDFGFLVAMLLMWTNVQRLDFSGAHAALTPMTGSPVVLAIALCLFLGCVGKSAQIPLYVWLPDAMAGPTPVSALIHAATMVTAGVYLVARAAPIFAGAPSASLLVSAVGALTALFAATIALRQWDIKKVLAYSTVSQLGYMFMAVGAGAYTAGVFHLVTHAFFKALLFLGAGSVIHALHAAYHHTHRHEDAQDMRNMGGLSRFMPATAGAMGIAALAIAGVPPFAGFFSKDEILSSVFARAAGSPLASASLLGLRGSAVLYVVYGAGVLTALLTAVYMTRMIMLTFTGTNRTGDGEREALHEAPIIMTAPVLVLALLTMAGGWLNLPAWLPLGRTGALEAWLEPVTGASSARLSGSGQLTHQTEVTLVATAVLVALVGIVFAVVRYRGTTTDKSHSVPDTGIAGVLTRAYGIDALLDRVLVRPINAFASIVLARGVDRGIDQSLSAGGSLFSKAAALFGARVQDGDVGRYAWMLAGGALAVLAAMALG